jgi:hypothetical protein
MRFISSLFGVKPAMRRPRFVAIGSCAAVLVAAGCDKSIGPFEVLPALDPSSLDPAAGSWRMILLTGPTQIAVPAPTAATSAAYLAELDAIKTSQSNLTTDQRNAIA